MRTRSGREYTSTPSENPVSNSPGLAPVDHRIDSPRLPAQHFHAALDHWIQMAGPGENRFGAAALIRECWALQNQDHPSGESLHLVGLGLTTLPSLGELGRLKHLFLEDNALQSLPESIGRLKRLEVLDVRGNQLERLPDTLGNLDRLVMLSAPNNRLCALPESIARLNLLIHLDISDNQFSGLPDSLAQMATLTTLIVSRNNLTQLPRSIGGAHALDTLLADHNQILSLPDSICALQNLVELDLEGNQVGSLPQGLAGMESLERLVLSDNHLQTVPEVIRQLGQCEVWLARNPFQPGEVERFMAEPVDAFVIFDDNNHADRLAMPLLSAMRRWRDVAPDLPDAAWHRSNHEHARHFGGWLVQLLDTPEFNFDASRPGLIKSVKTLLSQMDAYPDLRDTLFHLAHEASNSCTDNVMLGLNNMEMARQNHLAAQGQLGEDALFRLGVQMFRMKELTRIADNHARLQAESGRQNDPVEVHLAFQVGLRDQLDLPVPAQTMQFHDLAEVREKQLEDAAREIRQLEQQPAHNHIEQYDNTIRRLESDAPALIKSDLHPHPLALHLAADYTPWAAHVARNYPTQIEQQTTLCYRYLDWLDAQQRQGAFNEQQLIEAHKASKFYATQGVAYRQALGLMVYAQTPPAASIENH